MPVRKILVPLSGLYDPEDPESLDWPALDTALSVGQQLAAHVEVFCITGPPREPKTSLATWVPGHSVDQLIDMIEEEGEARHKRARASFEAAINRLDKRPTIASDVCAGFSVNFVERVGEIGESVSVQGRLADLVVVANSPEGWRLQYRPILDAALRDTGRPLLVSPQKPWPSIGRRIAIAWNGSIEASRAVSSLLGVIRPGAEVVIMSVEENGAPASTAKGAADYLRWHGVESDILELEGDARSSGDVILDSALDDNRDLLVMGACIHSHVHRVAFGSMTETVLSRAEIPVLMVT